MVLIRILMALNSHMDLFQTTKEALSIKKGICFRITLNLVQGRGTYKLGEMGVDRGGGEGGGRHHYRVPAQVGKFHG